MHHEHAQYQFNDELPLLENEFDEMEGDFFPVDDIGSIDEDFSTAW